VWERIGNESRVKGSREVPQDVGSNLERCQDAWTDADQEKMIGEVQGGGAHLKRLTDLKICGRKKDGLGEAGTGGHFRVVGRTAPGREPFAVRV